jgi:hypothetical protein
LKPCRESGIVEEMVASIVKKDFSQPASEEPIERTACALEANGCHTLVAEDGEQARRLFFQLVPDGAQVRQGHSATLDQLGITAELEQSGRFVAVRSNLRALDRQTQGEQICHLSACPDFMTGSVAVLTEDDRVFKASAQHTSLNKVGVFYKERPGRITIILVKADLGY